MTNSPETRSSNVPSLDECVCVLHVPWIAESIWFHPLLEAVGDSSMLEICCRFHNLNNAEFPLVILCHPGRLQHHVEEITRKHGLQIFVADTFSPFTALTQLLAERTERAVALVQAGMVFSPPSLLQKSVAHHLEAQSDYTRVDAAPRGAAPELFSRRALQALGNLPESQLGISSFRDLTTVLLKLERLKTTRLELRCSNLSASDLYPEYPIGGSMPEHIDSTSLEFPTVARETLKTWKSGMRGTNDFSGLSAWKTNTLLRSRIAMQEIPSLIRRQEEYRKPSRKLRLLCISYASGYSGAEEALCTTLAHRDRERFDVSALVPLPGKLCEKLRSLGVDVHLTGQEIGNISPEGAHALLRAIRKVNPDVIHLNGVKGQGPAWAAILSQIPIVQHARVHGDQYAGHLMNPAARVIAVSRLVAQQLSRLQVDPASIRVIYDGIDVSHFNPNRLHRAMSRKLFGIPENAKVVLQVARYVPYKRHDILIKAMAIVKQTIPDAFLVLVGEVFDTKAAKLYHEVLRAIREFKLSDSVRVLGFQEDIRTIESAADLLVLCSDREPLGICALEAMALEVPVVVTDSCGAAELIENEVSGLLARANDAESLARCIGIILSSEVSARRLGANGRIAVIRLASAQFCSRQFESIIEEAVTESCHGLQAAAVNGSSI